MCLGESHAPHSRGVDFVQRGVSHCVLKGSLTSFKGSLALRAQGESHFVQGESRTACSRGVSHCVLEGSFALRAQGESKFEF